MRAWLSVACLPQRVIYMIEVETCVLKEHCIKLLHSFSICSQCIAPTRTCRGSMHTLKGFVWPIALIPGGWKADIDGWGIVSFRALGLEMLIFKTHVELELQQGTEMLKNVQWRALLHWTALCKKRRDCLDFAVTIEGWPTKLEIILFTNHISSLSRADDLCGMHLPWPACLQRYCTEAFISHL